MIPRELNMKSAEEWNSILTRFAKEARMTACLTDSSGNIICCQGERYPLCQAIRESRKATTFICSQIASVMLNEVKVTMKPGIDLCDAGLLRVVVPIIRNGAVCGQITACGLATKEEELNTFVVADYLGISEEEVAQRAETTPFSSEQELQPLVDRLFRELNPDLQ